ncbi:MAG: substrate-binding domain-containing protein [Chloroflexota bacterium]
MTRLVKQGATIRLAFLLLIPWCFSSCTSISVASLPLTTISLAGSTAFLPVLSEVTEEFSQRHPNVLFDLRGGGIVLGQNQLLLGEIDLAMTTVLAPLVEEEGNNDVDTSLSNKGLNSTRANRVAVTASGNRGDADSKGGLTFSQASESLEIVRIPIGLDAIAIVVHATNDIQDLSLMEVQAIYSGRVLDWSELGGQDNEILLISREESSGTRQLFEERIMRDEEVSLTAVVMPSHADVLRYVASHPTAIGYLSRSYILSEERQNGSASVGPTGSTPQPFGTQSRNSFLAAFSNDLAKVKPVQLDGQEPTIEAILSQQYYLVYPLFLLSRGEPTGWPALFIEFVLGPSGQTIVQRYHAPVR